MVFLDYMKHQGDNGGIFLKKQQQQQSIQEQRPRKLSIWGLLTLYPAWEAVRRSAPSAAAVIATKFTWDVTALRVIGALVPKSHVTSLGLFGSWTFIWHEKRQEDKLSKFVLFYKVFIISNTNKNIIA